MTNDSIEWIFYCVPKDRELHGEPFGGTLEAVDLVEAFKIFDNEYGIGIMEEIEIKPLKNWRKK